MTRPSSNQAQHPERLRTAVKLSRALLVLLAVTLVLGSFVGGEGESAAQEGKADDAAMDPELTVGPSTEINDKLGCIKCHEPHYKAWRETHHFKSLAMHKQKLAKGLRKALRKSGVKRFNPKESKLCQNCHYTMVKVDGDVSPKYGVSCESCHGEGKRHVELHSNKKKGYDARMEAAARAGMIRPTNLYRLGQNCYQCHILAKDVKKSDAEPTVEQLVNIRVKGKKKYHPYGSKRFELLSWSQGEVRHNYSGGKKNPEAPVKRCLYVVGKLLDVEYTLRALSKATDAEGRFFKRIKNRLVGKKKKKTDQANAIDSLKSIRALIKGGAVAEAIDAVLEIVKSTPAQPNKRKELLAAADQIRSHSKKVFGGKDKNALLALEKELAPIQPLLPTKYKGKTLEER